MSEEFNDMMICEEDTKLRERRYGISHEEIVGRLYVQHGRCAICRNPLDERFHLDHCHMWGIVRGILCKSCNIGLGNFNDDEKLLSAALTYIKGYSPKVSP